MRGKRLLALLMAVVMLAGVSTMPMVYAEEVSENEGKIQEKVAPQISNVSINLASSTSTLTGIKMDQETYDKGVQVVIKNPEICTVSTTYAPILGESEYGLVTTLNALSVGKTVVYVQDLEGNVFQEIHLTVIDNEKIVYIDCPAMIQVVQMVAPGESAPDEWSTSNDHPETADAKVIVFESENISGYKSINVFLEIQGKQLGEANVSVSRYGMPQYSYHVKVEGDSPDNVVKFRDENLRYALAKVESTYNLDRDDDGYLTKEEMEQWLTLTVTDSNITDLSGLENAGNLAVMDLSGNTNLSNVTPLYQMERLASINLKNTNVSGQDILNLAQVTDSLTVREGVVRTLPSMFGKYVQADNITVSVLEGTDVIEILESEPVDYYDECWKAIGAGDAVIRISCRDAYKDIKVHVDGIDADQPLGEASDRDLSWADDTKLLDSVGRLWNTYPEMQLETSDVDKYVSGWVYGLDQAQTGEKYGYALCDDKTLWAGGIKIADNVKDAQGRYALTTDNKLIDIYNGTNDVQIEDVQKWSEGRTSYYNNSTGNLERTEITYVLKTDKTLWRRIESDKGEAVNAFEKIAENVKDIGYQKAYWGNSSYLLENGDLVSDDAINNTQTVAQSNLMNLPEQYYYQELDGNSYVIDYGKQQYVNVGKVNIKDALVHYEYNSETHMYIYYTYYLTDDKTLYCYTENDGVQVIARNVEEVSQDANYLVIYRGGNGLYRDIEGNIGTVDDPIEISAGSGYLQDYGAAGDYNFCGSDGAVLLTHVKNCVSMWPKAYLVRTDGTVWVAENDRIPVKVFDLDDEVNGSEMTDDQKEGALSDISSADRNTTVTVAMESAVILPAEILKAAQEKDATLECTLSDGTKWTISCGELKDEQLVDIDLTVIKTSKENGSISAEAITELAGTRDAEQLNFTDGGFDLAASISLAMDSAFANMKCVVVSLEENTEKLLGVAMVKDEQMTLALAQTKDCALVYGVNGDTSADGRVNITDLMQTLHHVSGRTVFGAVEQGISDVNLNGRTDITDLMQMLHYTSGRNEAL